MATTGKPALHHGTRPVAGAALVLGAASFWATFGIFAKHLYDAGFAPLELASVRAAVGFAGFALLMAPRMLLRQPAGAAPPAGGRRGSPVRAMAFFAAYGILGYALFTLVFFAALERLDVSIAVALLYTAPAFVMVMSALLWREHVGGVRLAALVLVLAGVVLVTGAAGTLLGGGPALPPLALALGVGAGATYGVYTMFSKVATHRYGPGASLFWSFAFAALAMGIVAPPWAPFLRAPEHVGALIALGIVPTLVPYALYLRGLRELRASTAAMLASVEPVIAALLAAVLLHERLDALQLAGMAMVVAAAVVLARQAAAGPARLMGGLDGRDGPG
ncbi:MAG TPA: DMT family transporter [Longimicrobiales bacterium]|nr:DMT family transporter [Longimicrobiales bacterium]